MWAVPAMTATWTVSCTWGIDGHNSHTNVCSSGARLGYTLWQGADRPSPDHANARFILMLSAHLETGHYFNPHAQRIIEGKMAGAKIAVIDTRLSNTAAWADYWLSAWPGSEAAILLAMAHVILHEERYDHAFMERWVNWETYLRSQHPAVEVTLTILSRRLRPITPPIRQSLPSGRAAWPPPSSWRWRAVWPVPGRPLPATSGAMPPRAMKAAGRWHAVSNFSVCSPAVWARGAARRPTVGINLRPRPFVA
jgi:anaerobic selenocysteine-containing dehydrogenase